MVIIPHRSFSQLISIKKLQNNRDMANLPRWVCLPGQRTEILKDVVLIFGGWNFAFTWRKPLLSCYLGTAKELIRKLQQHHSVILNETESACSGPVSAYVELFGCRPGSPETIQKDLNIRCRRWWKCWQTQPSLNLCWTEVLPYS